MFTIYGGKAAFDQWDQGQRVQNPEMAAGDKVIFLNGCGETHPMKAYTYEGSVVCDVPNDLLRMARPMLIDLCGSMEHRTRIDVRPRAKPEDYVYEDNTFYPQESMGSSGSGTVKSVNGVEPDESGNVQIETGGGSGGSVSWDDVTDKPFGERTEWVEVIPETSVTFTTGGANESKDVFASYPEFLYGLEYRVVFDGKEYDGLTPIYQGISIMPVFNNAMSEEYPFTFTYGNDRFYALEPGTHTVAVYKKTTVYYTLPAEYLPVGVTWARMNGTSPFRVTNDYQEPFSKEEFLDALNKGTVYLVGDNDPVDGKLEAADMIVGFNMSGSNAQITYISVGTDGQATLQTKTGLTFLK